MFSDEKLTELLYLEEIIMEGLDKNFWRLIKLSIPQVWKHQDEELEEYSWVLAVMGYHCIYFDGKREEYVIATFNDFGEIEESKQKSKQLHFIITDIVNSRFRLP